MEQNLTIPLDPVRAPSGREGEKNAYFRRKEESLSFPAIFENPCLDILLENAEKRIFFLKELK